MAVADTLVGGVGGELTGVVTVVGSCRTGTNVHRSLLVCADDHRLETAVGAIDKPIHTSSVLASL